MTTDFPTAPAASGYRGTASGRHRGKVSSRFTHRNSDTPGQGFVLAVQFALKALDALSVGSRGLRAGAYFFGVSQGCSGTGTPLGEFGRKNAMFATPGVPPSVVQRRRGDHRLKPAARRPAPPSDRIGLRLFSPTLQGLYRNPQFL
jgi:hypothetical protein